MLEYPPNHNTSKNNFDLLTKMNQHNRYPYMVGYTNGNFTSSPIQNNSNCNRSNTNSTDNISINNTVQWVCDCCKVCIFTNYEDAKRHEAVCRMKHHTHEHANTHTTATSYSTSSFVPTSNTNSNSNRISSSSSSSSASKNEVSSALTEVFVADSLGRWACKYCCSVPLRFRAPGATYPSSRSSSGTSIDKCKPTQEHIERHLEVCAGQTFYSATEPATSVDLSTTSNVVASESNVSVNGNGHNDAVSAIVTKEMSSSPSSSNHDRHMRSPEQHRNVSVRGASLMESTAGSVSSGSHHSNNGITSVSHAGVGMGYHHIRSTHPRSYLSPLMRGAGSSNAPPSMVSQNMTSVRYYPHHHPSHATAFHNGYYQPSYLADDPRTSVNVPTIAQQYPAANSNGRGVGPDIGPKSALYPASTLKLGQEPTPPDSLVFHEDKVILTDYFYYLMMQFRPCKFMESDRLAKGRKRDNIPVGFAGVQCRHCAGRLDGRKFFWSNVDRLANSFTEIPGHLLKCRKCPQNVRDLIIDLKKTHLEQMARLPRGSQKVFFRRMWRRLHEDSQDDKILSSPKLNATDGTSSPGSNQSDVSVSDGRILLSVPEDRDWLSDLDCFVRRNLEVFIATETNAKEYTSDRKCRVVEGQVGMRCVHCVRHHAKNPQYRIQAPAAFFPYMVCDIFEFVREFQKHHLNVDSKCKVTVDDLTLPSMPHLCPHMPSHVKNELLGLTNTVSSLNSMLKRYSVIAANALGLYDTSCGIRAKNDSILNNATVSLDMLADITIASSHSKREFSTPNASSKKQKMV